MNFGHPPPLVFSTDYRRFVGVDSGGMAHFLPLGLQIPEDHPDHALLFAKIPTPVGTSDVADISLMGPGDILFLYTDGAYGGSDAQDRSKLEAVMSEHRLLSAKDICNALLEFTVRRDARLLRTAEEDGIDDKTVFIIKKE